ncbi:MAG: 30S ribosomal protein S16 [Alphaproteobacteria bacterium MarineAlpha11_Bin1]|nr:MAG: 30S ribosomal protein S16 [Alphaproteobacteria bacterium MarineAlpha11_Bin1]
MSLKLRLSRGGAKKRPYYRIVVADSRMPRDGRYIERVGTYNPMLPQEHPDRIKLDDKRIKHWLSVGAKPSDRVAKFLGRAEIIPMPEIRETPKQSAPRAKTLERMREAEELAKAKAEADVSVEDTPAEEAPAEEAPTEEAVAKEAPTEESVAEEAPAEEAPTEESVAEEAPAEEAPAEEASTEKTDEEAEKKGG